MSKERIGEPSQREWKSFWSLIGMQSMNAFNDNFAKFLLMPLGVALAAIGQAPAGIEYVFGLLLVLPFILFAPTAGWLGDRFSKSAVIRWSSWMQLAVLVLMVGALWFGAKFGGSFSGLAVLMVMLAFFLLATQSALLSPSKMGVVKELVGTSKLGFANGVLEGTVIIAILLGQIIGGFAFDVWGLQVGRGPWEAALLPVMWVLIGAVISLVLAHAIQKTPAQATEAFSKQVALRHFGDLRKLVQDRALWRCTLGITFFWGFGGFLQFLLLQRAQERMGSLEGMGSETALLWLPVVVGIVLGSVLASWICRRRNEMGLVVVGGALMTLAMFALGALPLSEGWVRTFLAVAGGGGALFLVPLNAYLQDKAPENERGLIISASNLCINIGGIIALLIQFSLKAAGVPIWAQFLVAGVACAVMTVKVLKLLPQDFVRFIFLAVFQRIYRVRTVGLENIPKEGGVLMTPNHLLYIDAFLLSAACPRPIRFVMFADCFQHQWVGRFARLFDAVPISSSKARDAIRVTSEALKEGAVVCLFPEGQLSRTGTLSELKKGYQLMARRADCPVLPTYLDGVWGSVWSFSEGNFLKKLPRTMRFAVTVGFGELLKPQDDLEPAMRRLSRKTVEDREVVFRGQKKREPELLGMKPEGWVEVFGRCWSEEGRELRINALQLSQVHLIDHRMRVLVEWTGDALSGTLGILWPVAVGATVAYGAEEGEIEERARDLRVDCVVLRGREGRERLVEKLAEEGVLVLVFDDGVSDGVSFGGLAREGRVVTFARPHPDYETTTQLPQSGWKEGARGKLLPGVLAEEVGETDEEGFVTNVLVKE